MNYQKNIDSDHIYLENTYRILHDMIVFNICVIITLNLLHKSIFYVMHTNISLQFGNYVLNAHT